MRRCLPKAQVARSLQQLEEGAHPASVTSAAPSSSSATAQFRLGATDTPVGSAIGSTTAESNTSESVDFMPFELVNGEVEEASSMVPSAIERNFSGRPTRWSIGYLAGSVEGGRGLIVGGGSFGERQSALDFLSECTLSALDGAPIPYELGHGRTKRRPCIHPY